MKGEESLEGNDLSIPLYNRWVKIYKIFKDIYTAVLKVLDLVYISLAVQGITQIVLYGINADSRAEIHQALLSQFSLLVEFFIWKLLMEN